MVQPSCTWLNDVQHACISPMQKLHVALLPLPANVLRIWHASEERLQMRHANRLCVQRWFAIAC